MGNISDLEQRINAALERIGTGIESLGQAVPGNATEALEQSLQEERSANAQLEERLKALRERTSALTLQLEQKVERLQAQLSSSEGQVAELRAQNERLQENADRLRAQNETMVGDPHLVNSAMMAELEALRAARRADVAEMDAILSELKPLVGEG